MLVKAHISLFSPGGELLFTHSLVGVVFMIYAKGVFLSKKSVFYCLFFYLYVIAINYSYIRTNLETYSFGVLPKLTFLPVLN
jgi:hypothetical protein